MITQERLKELYLYSPITGQFYHRRLKRYTGSLRFDGYIKLSIDGHNYFAHRLAFLYLEGRFPDCIVDHINHNRTDNMWCNIRHATKRTNSENRIYNTRFIGVSWCNHTSKWRAQSSRENGGHCLIGRYDTHLAACYARWAHDINTSCPSANSRVAPNS